MRRVGIAVTTAVVLAAPVANMPAPWSGLVGASVGDAVRGVTVAGSTDLNSDLFRPRPQGPAPQELPGRGLPGGVQVGLDTAANPSAAGLPTTGGNNSIPATALLAYKKAADRLAVEDPSCHLPWSLLAGIGRVESNHARGWGSNSGLTAAGVATPAILGPVLDGSVPGTARLLDTDGGQLDGNASFDRAVGPLQFVPGTWKLLGRDGNGDGVADPNNIWDASLSAGAFLCDGGRDLSNPAAQSAAVFAYNPSQDYVAPFSPGPRPTPPAPPST